MSESGSPTGSIGAKNNREDNQVLNRSPEDSPQHQTPRHQNPPGSPLHNMPLSPCVESSGVTSPHQNSNLSSSQQNLVMNASGIRPSASLSSSTTSSASGGPSSNPFSLMSPVGYRGPSSPPRNRLGLDRIRDSVSPSVVSSLSLEERFHQLEALLSIGPTLFEGKSINSEMLFDVLISIYYECQRYGLILYDVYGAITKLLTQQGDRYHQE